MVTEIELFESTDLTPLDFCWWGWMKSEVYKRKVDTQDKFLACILDAAARIKKCDMNLDEEHAIFAHELPNVLRLTVGFSNVYCQLQQTRHFCVTNWSFQH
jgi:hypothetical protein